MVKDFVRLSLYSHFADFIPKDKKTRAAYINRMMMDRQELLVISEQDYGEFKAIFDSVKGDKDKADELIKYIEKSKAQKIEQVMSGREVGTLESVVKTLSQESGDSRANQKDDLIPMIQPPILVLDNTTDKKILQTDLDSASLNGNKMFISLSDRMNSSFRHFFLLPHSTKVIWSMHRIIYIFSDITSTMSLYYEMELTTKLPEDNTGGEPIRTTTIVTKGKIFVPVIPSLYYYQAARN
jgi:molecular chaperone HtpG